MKYLGYGIGRVVFEDSTNNNYVIKYPYNNEGIKQNQEECETFQNNNQNGVYADCYLDENNCLHMEKLTDCSTDFNRYVKGDTFKCTKFDNSIKKKISFSNCVKGCIGCAYRKDYTFTQDEVNTILANKTKDRLQVGYDINGKIKFYDYAVSTKNAADITFLFNSAYVSLFEEYLVENPTMSVLFDEWIKDKTLPNKNLDGLAEGLMNCNYWKRKQF